MVGTFVTSDCWLGKFQERIDTIATDGKQVAGPSRTLYACVVQWCISDRCRAPSNLPVAPGKRSRGV